jgi:hypothetical protein
MCEMHLVETELACVGDGKHNADATEHLRWCAQCRSAVAEYAWLQGQVAAALATAADTVTVPRSRWRAVRRRLAAERQRQIAGWRASAVASAVLAVCLVLAASPVLGVAVAQASLPARATLPSPVTDVVSGDHAASTFTPTPAAFGADTATPSAPPLVPLPTPFVEPGT